MDGSYFNDDKIKPTIVPLNVIASGIIIACMSILNTASRLAEKMMTAKKLRLTPNLINSNTAPTAETSSVMSSPHL
jgi:hypothetical protein